MSKYATGLDTTVRNIAPYEMTAQHALERLGALSFLAQALRATRSVGVALSGLHRCPEVRA